MDFETFARCAEDIVDEIPEEFLAGVSGVEIHEEREDHPHVPGLYTLGMCASDDLRRMGDPEDTTSRVHLYHGSFLAVARRDPSFDWDEELRETILHEIRHHIEDRAGLPDLRREDELYLALTRFRADEELPDGWYPHGEPLDDDAWIVEDDVFVELRLRPAELESLRGRLVNMTLVGESLELEIPADARPGETLTYAGEGMDGASGRVGDLHLILRSR